MNGRRGVVERRMACAGGPPVRRADDQPAVRATTATSCPGGWRSPDRRRRPWISSDAAPWPPLSPPSAAWRGAAARSFAVASPSCLAPCRASSMRQHALLVVGATSS